MTVRRNRSALIAVAILVVLYIAVFTATSILTFRNFGMSAFDIGIHVQAIWKLSTGGGLFNTVRGLNIWGDHCWFIMVLYAPLYWLIPKVETLLALQSFALAVAAFPLAAMLQRRSAGNLAVVVFAVAWLLSPALQNMNLENFHPEVLAAPLLLWAIERADARKWRGYWLAVGAALLCKEDVALTTFMLGFWVFFTDRRIGILTIIVSVAWFLLCMKVFLPFFNGQGFFRFDGGYWFNQFWNSKFDPEFYWSTFTQARVAEYAWRLLLPTAGLFLLDPLLALAAIPAFTVNVLSGNNYLISIDYHYNFQTLPIIFAAAARGYCRLAYVADRFPAVGRITLLAVLVLAIWCNDRWSHLPAKAVGDRLSRQYVQLRESSAVERFDRIRALLPEDPGVPISVSHNLLPHLANRSYIYMFPNPFQPTYWGIGGENLPPTDTISTLLLDTNAWAGDNPGIWKRLLETRDFLPAERDGPLLLATRGPGTPRIPIDDPMALQPPAGYIRLLIYPSSREVRSLTSLRRKTPDIDLSTTAMQIPPTTGRLQSAEGLDLGASDNLRVFFLGQWEAAGEGAVTFRIQADDGCRLYVDGAVIIDYDGVHSYRSEERSLPLQLQAGRHAIALDYFEWGGEAGVRVEWAGPDGEFMLLEAGQTLP